MQTKSASVGRKPDAVEQSIDCPTCDAVKGEACRPARFGGPDETTEYPHNKRYVAAHVDYWKAHEATATEGRPHE